jgi:hypothetical protein
MDAGLALSATLVVGNETDKAGFVVVAIELDARVKDPLRGDLG